MPGFNKPAGQWLGNTLAATIGNAAAATKQGTEYIVDQEGVCRAIIGHLVAEPDGTSTGLTGWGIAVKLANLEWIGLGTSPLGYAVAGEVPIFTLGSASYTWQEIPKSPSLTIPFTGTYLIVGFAEYVSAHSVPSGAVQLNVGVGSATSTIYASGSFVGDFQFSAAAITAMSASLLSGGTTLRMYAGGNSTSQEWAIGARWIFALPFSTI